jgi:hypothetical protein
MKRAGKIAICLAGGLVLNAGLRADDGVLANNPYAPIVIRNVFGLNPPTPPAAPVKQDVPLPKITPNGIMSILGRLQVLFKVDTVATPGKPSVEESYILTEGQRQDDIEIVKINEKAAMVTFNNNGVIQEIGLNNSANPPPAATTMSPYPRNRFGHNRFGGQSGNGGWNNAPPGPTFGVYSPPASQPPVDQPPVNQQPNYQQPANQLPEITPEQQVIAIEANRIVTQQQVEDGTLPPLPITEMTPSDATAAGGRPLNQNGDASVSGDNSGNNDASGNGDNSGNNDASRNGDMPPQ